MYQFGLPPLVIKDLWMFLLFALSVHRKVEKPLGSVLCFLKTP